jgi:bifunctional non-homologous end joining protein LigD
MNVQGREIKLSHQDKPLFPDGTTKGDLVRYYLKIGETMVPHMAGRPLAMHRFPDGVEGESFYQKDMPDYFPPWIHHVTLEKEDGTVTHVVCDDVATLVYLANQACITPHLWLSKRQSLHHPDRLIFDLDPSDESFEAVREGALFLKKLLEGAGLTPFVMTTGGRGLHVTVPLDAQVDFDTVRAMALSLAQQLVRADPDRFTTEQRKVKRAGRVFIDTNRNAYAQTAVAPYAVRARQHPSVATPLDWDEVNDTSLTPDKYTLENIFRRLAQKPDPWRDIDRHAARAAALSSSP